MAEEMTGGCLCGAVRYRARGITRSGHCHCRMCQKAGGAPVVSWASVPPDGFEVTSGTLAAYRSSARAFRHFCPKCGSQITWREAENPKEIDISLATFDHPEKVTPQYHIYTSTQQPWLHIEDDLPRYPEGRH